MARRTAVIAGLVVLALMAGTPPEASAQQVARVSPIDAVATPQAPNGDCTPPRCSTEYRVLVAVPTGPPPIIRWSGPDCGTFGAKSGEPATFVWHHPHPPCDQGTGHSHVLVVVEVAAGSELFRCEYRGAETGAGPPCTVALQQSAPTTVPGVASTPTIVTTVTTPVDEPESSSATVPLMGGLLVVIAGAGWWYYSRGRRRDMGASSPTFADDQRWSLATYNEEQAQQRLLQNYRDVLQAWGSAWAGFKAGATQYAESYLRAWQGSDALQQLARDWQVNQQAAKAADLAVALIMLVRGVGQLGAMAFRWMRGLRGGQAAAGAAQAAAGATEYAQAVGRAEQLIENSPALREMAEQLAQNGKREELVQLAVMAEEAGVPFEQFMLSQRELMSEFGLNILARLDRVFAGLARRLIDARGWIKATDDARGVINTMLVNGRGLVTGTSTLTPQQAQAIRALVRGQDDFFEWSAKLYDEGTELATNLGQGAEGMGAGAYDFFGLVCNADDIAFMRALWQALETCGDDLARVPQVLRDLLGPARVAAVEAGAAAGVSVSAVGAGVTAGAGATGAAVQLADGTIAPRPIIGAVGNAESYFQQFGIVGESFGSNMWDLVTSPIETTTGMWHSHVGLTEWNTFMENHSGDLRNMSLGLTNAMGSLERMQNLLNSARPGDPAGPLNSARTQLRNAADELQRAYDQATPQWQREHADELQRRRAHIEQKLTMMEAATSWIGEMQAKLPALVAALESLRRDAGGQQVYGMELLNPDTATALVQMSLFLEGGGWGAFGGGEQRRPLTTDEIAQRSRELDEYQRRMAEEFDSHDEVEYERQWQEQLRALDAPVNGQGPR
jgi:hypothetical protein